MGLRDCSSPAPASRTLDVKVLAPLHTNLQVSMPCNHARNGSRLPPFNFFQTFWIRMLQDCPPTLWLFSLKEEGRFWAAQLQQNYTSTTILQLSSRIRCLSRMKLKWCVGMLLHFAHLARIRLHFSHASSDPLANLTWLPLGTSATSSMTWMSFAWNKVICGFCLTCIYTTLSN